MAVDGCSASQLLGALKKSGDKLDVEIPAHIAFKVAEGLHSAHETRDEEGNLLGIVHRDVSPSNVLFSREGSVKIIDFGIAKARGRIAGTETGYALKGKIRYMSPEQAHGEEVDRRSDVYALGVVLWELLAAERAFEAENEFALLDKVRDPQLRSIRDIREDVPEALDEVLRKATSPKPSDRYESAYELSRAIASAVPAALLVDQDSFRKLVDRVPKTRGKEPGPGSASAVSWVSDMPYRTPSSHSGSMPALAYGSSPRNDAPTERPPRASTDFDPSVFTEPTPLPAYDEYDSVVVHPPAKAAAEERKPWLTTSRAILLGGALVAGGIMFGIIYGSSRGANRVMPPPAAVAPAVTATETPVAETKPEPKVSETVVPEPVVTAPAEPVLEPAPVVIDAPARTRVRRPRRARPTPEPKPAAATTKVDGVTIAGDRDDEGGGDRKTRTDKPSRAGKTPIAEGFDD